MLDELHTYRGRQGSDVACWCDGSATPFGPTGSSASARRPRSPARERSTSSVPRSLGWPPTCSGTTVRPEDVIGETLRRATAASDLDDAAFRDRLTRRVADPGAVSPAGYRGFVADPLSFWIEATFGLRAEPESGRLVRARPRSITGPDGAAAELAGVTGVPEERCAEVIRDGLLGGYRCERNPETGFPAFAFRLHQFISRGDTAYATVEPEAERYVTVQGQQYVPGDRSRVLLPLAFCRECGQEYYSVRSVLDEATGRRVYVPRDLTDLQSDDDEQGRVPVRQHRRPLARRPGHRRRPRARRLGRGAPRGAPRPAQPAQGSASACPGRPGCAGGGWRARLPLPPRAVPVLPALRGLLRLPHQDRLRQAGDAQLRGPQHRDHDPRPDRHPGPAPRGVAARRARKLLCFTDNRQDASLQAGHFNDFVEISLLRSALFKAVRDAGPDGLTHDDLTQKVFDALDLPIELYAFEPNVRFAAAAETKKALRDVLGYRLYRDLRRGWRVTSPNLEQCGLLEIGYQSLDEVCAAEDVWAGQAPGPGLGQPLDPPRGVAGAARLHAPGAGDQGRLPGADGPGADPAPEQPAAHPPVGIDENETLDYAAVLYPRANRGSQEDGSNVYLSPRAVSGSVPGPAEHVPDVAGPPGWTTESR